MLKVEGPKMFIRSSRGSKRVCSAFLTAGGVNLLIEIEYIIWDSRYLFGN